MTAAVRGAIRGVDPEQPIFDVDAMDKNRGGFVWNQTVADCALTFFAVVALVFVGGLVRNRVVFVGHGRQEMGVRMAMGDSRRMWRGWLSGKVAAGAGWFVA